MKTTRENLLGNNDSHDCGFLSGNHKGQKEVEQHFKNSSRKELSAQNFSQEMCFKNVGKTKMFSDEGKLGEFVARRPRLKDY